MQKTLRLLLRALQQLQGALQSWKSGGEGRGAGLELPLYVSELENAAETLQQVQGL